MNLHAFIRNFSFLYDYMIYKYIHTSFNKLIEEFITIIKEFIIKNKYSVYDVVRECYHIARLFLVFRTGRFFDLRGSKGGESPHARLSFIRRSLTWALPLKITDAGRAGTERCEIKKEYEKRL